MDTNDIVLLIGLLIVVLILQVVIMIRLHRVDRIMARQQPRAWYRDVVEADREAEITFLHSEIYGRAVELPMRCSCRCETDPGAV